MSGDLQEGKEVTLDLNFVPQWARKPPGENHYVDYTAREERRPSARRAPARRREERSSSRGERSERPPRERAPVREIPVTVSFFPEQKRLASLVRQIHRSRRAYPLMDLANLFIQDPDGYLVKVELNEDAPEDFRLWQCSICKAVSCSREQMEQHLFSSHLEDYFETEEVEGEPPSGQFVCVARCRRTGVILGPPNHHSYAEKLAELHRTRFPHLSLEEVKRNIETVKDEALIEQWREESRKKVLFRRKGEADAEPMERARAEIEFRKRIPELIEETRRAIMPSRVAQNLDDRDVTHAIRKAWSKESRFPLTMSFAMRAAFRHMHLHIFKAGRINFVTHIKPRPLRPENTVEQIAEILLFLEEHPGSTRRQVLEALHPEIDPQSKEAVQALQPVNWLVERGHIIEFFNGTLSLPLGIRRR